MGLEKLTKNVKTIAIICNQWGDTGKGKFSDYFASTWADVIARGTGGNNAGHTVVVNGKERIFHLLPAGIVYDGEGKTNILGNGMVLDLKVLNEEMDELKKEGTELNNLMISEDANVIMPYHIQKDKQNSSLKNGGIGSTGRGIGPAYADKIARRGILIRDLLSEDTLAKKIKKAAENYPNINVNVDKIIEDLKPYIENIKPHIRNTISEMHDFVKAGKNILIEGAQGLLLSVEYGTYPYVTSSDCSINGTAGGVGLSAKAIDLTLGIVKFPYMTRVGGGPFPTEFGGKKSEDYCAEGLEHDVKFELKNYDIPFKEVDGKIKYTNQHDNIIRLINSNNAFEQGVGIRLAGFEYGATTGRPRRPGRTDLVALKYAVGINGPNIILTKADVLQGADIFKLGVGYDGNRGFTRDSEKLYDTTPNYMNFPGFKDDISQITDYKNLPDGLRMGIEYLEKFTGANVRLISTGAERSATIIKE